MRLSTESWIHGTNKRQLGYNEVAKIRQAGKSRVFKANALPMGGKLGHILSSVFWQRWDMYQTTILCWVVGLALAA
jgi:hypothetical protein